MSDASNQFILVIGTGTAGCRAAAAFSQLGQSEDVRVLLTDADAIELSRCPEELERRELPTVPPLPVGMAADAARQSFFDALEPYRGQISMVAVLTCLGGATGSFYAQAAAQYAKVNGINAIIFAALPHATDGEEHHANAERALGILRSEHFEVLTLDCARMAGLFPGDAAANRYGFTIRWLSSSLFGYLKPFLTVSDTMPAAPLSPDTAPRGIFAASYPTNFGGQDLDIPTYLRKSLKLPLEPN